MHFFDFWFAVSPLALLRLAVPAALLLLLTLLPGRGVAAAASFGMAIAVLFLRELATP